MSAYLGLVIAILLFWICTNGSNLNITIKYKTKARSVNIFFLLSFFSAFIVMGCRGEEVGVDTANYNRYFKEVSYLRWDGLLDGGWDHYYFSTEKGFMVFEKILSYLSDNSQILIFVSAAIYIGCIYSFFKEYSGNRLMDVAVFLSMGSYLLGFNAMRQSIAVGFCCLAWKYLQENKSLKTLLWLGLAISFHISSIIFFLFILFKYIPAKKNIAFFAIIVTIVFSIMGEKIVYKVIRYFPTYYARYGRGKWEISDANGIIFVWIFIGVLIGIIIYNSNWEDNINHLEFEIVLAALSFIAIQVLGQSFDGLQRLSMLFQPFLVLLFRMASIYFRGYKKKIYDIIVTVLMFSLFIRMASTSQYIYVPYWG